MRITLREPAIGREDGFKTENDVFGYKEFGERLANLVGNISEPLVVVLDGPWGSGKSVFARQWAGLLRQRGAPVVEFDAFANDHYEDGFVAISAEILATAEEMLGKDKSATKKYRELAAKVGVAVTRTAMRSVLRIATYGVLGTNDANEIGNILKDETRATVDSSAVAIEKMMSDRLSQARDEKNTLDTFRAVLEEIAIDLAASESKDDTVKYPLVFIVDELDRCRPPFALSIIERIKHLFSVNNVCFVLVTHMQQLEGSVQGAYGTNFEAQTYLEKFYQLRVTIPDKLAAGKSIGSQYIDYCWAALEIEFPHPKQSLITKEHLEIISESLDLSLRQLDRVITLIAIASACLRKESFCIPAVLAGLCVMRQVEPELYKKARNMQLRWNELIEFLMRIPRDQTEGQRAAFKRAVKNKPSMEWWAFLFGGTLTADQVAGFESYLSEYDILDREDAITTLCSYIDNFFISAPDRQ